MFSKYAALFTAAVVFKATFGAAITVDTPATANACAPLSIIITGGTAPYYVALVPGGDPCADAIVELPQTNDANVSLNVTIPPKTSVMIAVEDATGADAWSAAFEIGGTDTSCLSSIADIAGLSSSAAPSAPAGSSSSRTALTASQTKASSSAKPTSSGGAGAGADGLGNAANNTPSSATSNMLVSTSFVALVSAISAFFVLA